MLSRVVLEESRGPQVAFLSGLQLKCVNRAYKGLGFRVYGIGRYD